MKPNKSIMTSYIKSRYFRHIPISVILDLTLNHITDVAMLEKKNVLMKVSSVNDEVSLEKVHCTCTKDVRDLICTNFTDRSQSFTSVEY